MRRHQPSCRPQNLILPLGDVRAVSAVLRPASRGAKIKAVTTSIDAIASPVLERGAKSSPAEVVLERLRGLAGDGGEGWNLFGRDAWPDRSAFALVEWRLPALWRARIR